MCQGMRWAHLPEPGGLYDQNPELLEHFSIIFHAQAKEQQRQDAERQAKIDAEKNKPRSRRGR